MSARSAELRRHKGKWESRLHDIEISTDQLHIARANRSGVHGSILMEFIKLRPALGTVMDQDTVEKIVLSPAGSRGKLLPHNIIQQLTLHMLQPDCV